MTTDTKTMTVEEVEKVSAEVISYLYPEDKDGIVALSRLAAQAARVPGLEADALRLAETAEESEKACIQAESERDAARKEAEENLARALSAEKGAEEEEAALRERVATLSEDLEQAEKRLAAIDTGCSNCGGLPHTITCRARDAVALLAKADTAEARVKELEALCTQLRANNATYEEMADSILESETSQPPPAPAQGPNAEQANRLHQAVAAAAEFLINNTPIYPGSDVANDLLAAHAATTVEHPTADLARLEDALYHEDAKGSGRPL